MVINEKQFHNLISLTVSHLMRYVYHDLRPFPRTGNQRQTTPDCLSPSAHRLNPKPFGLKNLIGGVKSLTVVGNDNPSL